jgi:hypothetical protein
MSGFRCLNATSEAASVVSMRPQNRYDAAEEAASDSSAFPWGDIFGVTFPATAVARWIAMEST